MFNNNELFRDRSMFVVTIRSLSGRTGRIASTINENQRKLKDPETMHKLYLEELSQRIRIQNMIRSIGVSRFLFMIIKERKDNVIHNLLGNIPYSVTKFLLVQIGSNGNFVVI